MINEQKERNVLTKMSDLEYTKNDLEMMRYRNNKLAYSLGLGGMAFAVLACFFELNSLNAGTFNTMIIIALNIIILLGGFLGCERTKSYSKGGCISLFVFAGVVMANIYNPIILMIDFATFRGDDAVAAAEAKANLGPSVYSHYVSGATSSFNYFWASGITRGVFIIIFLIASAALFVAGGVIGYLRSKKLTDYLTSIGSKM